MEIKWQPAMSVGNEEIDRQHKKAIKMLNKLISFVSVDHLGDIRKVIHFTEEYVHFHFDYEENYMKEINYPHLAKHKKLHEEYQKFVDDFKEEFNSIMLEKSVSSIKLKKLHDKAKKFLGEWFVNHTLTADLDFQKYGKEHSKAK